MLFRKHDDNVVSHLVASIGDESDNTLGNLLSQYDSCINRIGRMLYHPVNDRVLACVGNLDAADYHDTTYRFLVLITLHPVAMLD